MRYQGHREGPDGEEEQKAGPRFAKGMLYGLAGGLTLWAILVALFLFTLS